MTETTPYIDILQSLSILPPTDNLSFVLNLKILPSNSEVANPFYGIWLLDLSASMKNNNKIDAARNSLVEQLKIIPDGTIFNLVTYGNPVEVPAVGVKISSKTREQMITLVQQLKPFGSTPLHEGLKKAFSILEDYNGGLQTKKIIFLGDGQPNWGCSREDMKDPKFKGYIKYAAKAVKLGASFDAVGVGDEHNVLLMYQMALQSTGKYIFANDAEELQSKLTIATNQATKIVHSNPTLLVTPEYGTVKIYEAIQHKPTTIRVPFEKIGKQWKAWLRSFEAGETYEIILKCGVSLDSTKIGLNMVTDILNLTFDVGGAIVEKKIQIKFTTDQSKFRLNQNLLKKYKNLLSQAEEISDCTIKGDAAGTQKIQGDETRKN